MYLAAIDQGTTSTRCIIFTADGAVVSSEQLEHRQHFPQPGWVEHDLSEIWTNTRKVCAAALATADLKASDIAACGITNQRETTAAWRRSTGEPLHRAIVWQDTRTAALMRELGGDSGPDRFRDVTGLPLSTYFSGGKMMWLLANSAEVRQAAADDDLCLGTIDSWLIFKMTGSHQTDVTNASRTGLMNLRELRWEPSLLAAYGIPRAALPEIASSAYFFGNIRERGVLSGVPLAAAVGDQHAAMIGQACLDEGDAKTTYGTGNFLLQNTGTTPVNSSHGLLTTLCYQFGDDPAVYALEGSVAVTGSLVQWLRDNLGIIETSSDIGPLAESVADNGGVYFVPAFSGLLAPRWRDDARGVVVGLTRYATKAHIARAALEATAYQTREVLEAMVADTGTSPDALKVDGGMVANDLLMQFQADQLGVPVARPEVTETTALGAALASGIATGILDGPNDIRQIWRQERLFTPQPSAQRDELYALWNRAVERSLNWP